MPSFCTIRLTAWPWVMQCKYKIRPNQEISGCTSVFTASLTVQRDLILNCKTAFFYAMLPLVSFPFSFRVNSRKTCQDDDKKDIVS